MLVPGSLPLPFFTFIECLREQHARLKPELQPHRFVEMMLCSQKVESSTGLCNRAVETGAGRGTLLLLAALLVPLLFLSTNHNVALCQGGVFPKKNIRTKINCLKIFMKWSSYLGVLSSPPAL
jgi:hypothetical protein